MTIAISTRSFDLVRAFLRQEAGITLPDDKVYLVENRLAEILAAQGLPDHEALLRACRDPNRAGLKAQVIDALTTNETLWFRDTAPFDAFRDHLLPAWAAEIAAGQRRRIRVWSAACSTGQEPYSLAMIARDAAQAHPHLRLDQLDILATDVSESVLARASEGVYGGMAVQRGLPDEMRDRHFIAKGDRYEVRPEIRGRVVFRKFNLQDSFLMMGSFDLILLRYVLIYFDDAFKVEVLRKAHGALEPGGVLMVGASESLPVSGSGFSLVRRGRATWYQKAGGPATPPPAPPAAPIADNGDSLAAATRTLTELTEQLRLMNAKAKTGPVGGDSR